MDITSLRDFMEVAQAGQTLIVCEPSLAQRGISSQFTTKNVSQFEGETPQYSRKLREAGYVFLGMSNAEQLQDHFIGDGPKSPCPVFGELANS